MRTKSRVTGRTRIPIRDIFRATLADNCGNVGFIGLHPQGSEYHVVVPVDYQIARGVMAANRPTDGTPFGGYTGWLYFECEPYQPPCSRGSSELDVRWAQSRANATVLVGWAAGRGLEIEVVD